MPNIISQHNRNFLVQMVGRGIVFNCGHQKLKNDILRNDYQHFKQFANDAPIGVSLTYTDTDAGQQYKITVIEPQELTTIEIHIPAHYKIQHPEESLGISELISQGFEIILVTKHQTHTTVLLHKPNP